MTIVFTVIFALLALVLGSCLASFYGVIISRVPKGMSIVTPPSHCFHCNEKIAWYDNIPILSYLILRGKCRHCHVSYGSFYFYYELLNGLASAGIVAIYGLSYETIFVFLIFQILYLLAGYDLQTFEMLDINLIIYGVISLGFFFFRVFYLKDAEYVDLLLGAALGLVFFGLVKIIGKWILKKDCLGGGDVILMTISGLFLGLIPTLFAILVGSLVGTIIEVIKIKVTKKEGMIAFGPYLALGTFVSLLLSEYIMMLF